MSRSAYRRILAAQWPARRRRSPHASIGVAGDNLTRSEFKAAHSVEDNIRRPPQPFRPFMVGYWIPPILRQVALIINSPFGSVTIWPVVGI